MAFVKCPECGCELTKEIGCAVPYETGHIYRL